MKKTILSIAAVLMLTVTGVYAETKTDTIIPEASVFAKSEVNPFCRAIMQGDIETVKKFIELGEDVNQKSLGMTPVIFAARYNKADILTLLIANGAKASIKCDKGFTAKKYAEVSGAQDALKVLEAIK